MQGRSLLVAFNAGSSSLKVELFGRDSSWRSDLRAVVDGIGRDHATLRVGREESEELASPVDHRAAAELVLERLVAAARREGGKLVATAHRIVHGGDTFTAPTLVTASVLAELSELTPLAPLHNPPALAVLERVRERASEVPAVAVFDTAFFGSLPAHARAYAIPAEWRKALVKRYGFHGLAHEQMQRRCAALGDGRAQRVVTLQLGNGCSAAALRAGVAVDTSMGFTPLEGLVMGTRGGDVDPGVLLHLARAGLTWQDIDQGLNRGSGLLGLSEQSSDMRELLELEAGGEPRAKLAIAAFCHRARKYIGAYAAVLGGLDALVFGGGIGENAPAVRARICAGFEWLGLALDERANDACHGTEAMVSDAASQVAVYVVPVHEERALARHACECLALDGAGLD